MASNLLAVAQSPIEWRMVSERYRNTDRTFEVFPITDPECGDAIGVSIPTNHFNKHSWRSASNFLIALAASCPLKVYDMYGGHAVDVTTFVPAELDAG